MKEVQFFHGLKKCCKLQAETVVHGRVSPLINRVNEFNILIQLFKILPLPSTTVTACFFWLTGLLR